jgi:type II secretory pathway component PulF
MFGLSQKEKQERAQRHFSESIGVSFIRFPIKEQTLFAKRLSFLIKAGVPLVEGLELIRNQTKSRGKSRMFTAIIEDVSAGQFLSTSLGKFKNHFGDFTVNLIRVGEHAGILSQNLMYLADELAKKHALQRKVRGSLIYPAFITMTTLGVTGMLTVFIFPKIMPVFVSLNIELPFTTRMLLWMSIFLSNYGLYLILGIFIAVGLFMFVRTRIPRLHYATDRILLSLPIAGDIARSYNVANFCRTLGLLLHSGVHVTEALLITASITKNLVYRRACERIAQGVLKGDTISKHITFDSSIFPDMLPHMVMIGEKTGSLTETLGYLSELYETEVEEKTKNLSNSIEPVLLVTMGLIVGLIAVSVITPIYDITKNLGNR